MVNVIDNIAQITPEWLTELLAEKENLSQGKVIWAQKRSYTTFKSTIVHLDLEYSVDVPKSIPTKMLLKITRPEYREQGKHESDFYNIIAPTMNSSYLVHCYAATYSFVSDRSYILLDDISRTHFQPESSLPITRLYAEQIVNCLAHLHAYWWEHPMLTKDFDSSPSLESIKRFVPSIESMFPEFSDFLGDRLSPTRRALYEKVFTCWPPPSLLKRLLERTATTLTHGDAYEGNFLYPNKVAQDNIYIIDWQDWHINIGTNDLASIFAKNWYPERRVLMEKELIRSYYIALMEYGVKQYSWDQCWHDYRTSAIFNLFWPIFIWTIGAPASIWWPILEKAMLAYQDLECEELLAG